MSMRRAAASARLLAALALVSAAPAACGAVPARAPLGQALPHGEIRTLVIRGRVLEGSWNGDSADREVEVYLPPNYAASRRRYPVIYLLHGYKGSARQWISDPDWNIESEMDKAIASGLQPMIIVMPDARTRAGGSYYVNSPADGAWETFITHELVGEIDRRFRTIASSQSRGIAGHSMGGYGALYLAFHHPRVFGSVYALSPCCLSFDGDLSLNSPEWRTVAGYKGFDAFSSESHYLAQALAGMAIAWSPDRRRAPFHADFPVVLKKGALELQPAAARRWRDFMIVPNVKRWWPNIRRLCAIGFDAGAQDQFTHIPIGERRLDAALAANHAKHFFELYKGDHNSGVPGRITSELLPFFAAAFRKCDGRRGFR
jgi:pimeloyl-ACP methyl ester carboxylesterase